MVTWMSLITLGREFWWNDGAEPDRSVLRMDEGEEMKIPRVGDS